MTKRIDRRSFIRATASAAAVSAAASVRSGAMPAVPAFELEEATINALQKAMASGAHNSRSLVEAYLERIAQLDRTGPNLRAVIETNPEALEIAAALDRERKAEVRAARCTAFRSSSRTTSTPATG